MSGEKVEKKKKKKGRGERVKKGVAQQRTTRACLRAFLAYIVTATMAKTAATPPTTSVTILMMHSVLSASPDLITSCARKSRVNVLSSGALSVRWCFHKKQPVHFYDVVFRKKSQQHERNTAPSCATKRESWKAGVEVLPRIRGDEKNGTMKERGRGTSTVFGRRRRNGLIAARRGSSTGLIGGKCDVTPRTDHGYSLTG